MWMMLTLLDLVGTPSLRLNFLFLVESSLGFVVSGGMSGGGAFEILKENRRLKFVTGPFMSDLLIGGG